MAGPDLVHRLHAGSVGLHLVAAVWALSCGSNNAQNDPSGPSTGSAGVDSGKGGAIDNGQGGTSADGGSDSDGSAGDIGRSGGSVGTDAETDTAVNDGSAGSAGESWDGPFIPGDGALGTDGQAPGGAVIMTVDTTLVRTLPAAFHGYNYVAYWDDYAGSPGSIAGLHRMGMQISRFPGGIPALFWSWNDPYKDGWSHTSSDDLWADVQRIKPGGMILFQTNTTTQHGNDPSGANVKAWVEYTLDKGMNAKLWEVGNEPDGTSKEAYLQVFSEHAKAIHDACPTCVVMGPGIWGWDMSWVQSLIDTCGADVDAISMHAYGKDNSTPGNPSPPGWWGPRDRRGAQDWFDRYDQLHAITNKPIYITEWSINARPEWYHLGAKVAGAVADADVIGAMCKTPNVAGHTHFGSLHNIAYNWGYFGDGSHDHDYLGPDVDLNAAMVPMMHLWASVMGRKVFTLTHSADIGIVNGWAHGREDGSIQVMLINKEPTPTSVRVEFTAFDPTGHSVKVYELRGLNGTAWSCPPPDDNCTHYFYNGVADAQFGDRTHKAPDAGADAGGIVYTGSVPPPYRVDCKGPYIDELLPPLSITVLDFSP